MDALTSQIEDWLARFVAGDDGAWTELQRHVQDRVKKLSHVALNGFPGVRLTDETGDIHNDVYVRMEQKKENLREFLRREGTPYKTRFISWCCQQIRDILKERLRRWRLNSAPMPTDVGDLCGSRTHDPEQLAIWGEFHEAVEQLDPDLLDVVNLRWYQGLNAKDTAEILGVSRPTADRRWVKARFLLLSKFPGAQFRFESLQ